MSEKIALFSVISLLLIVPFVIGEDFSGYKYPSDKFSLNGDNFSIQLSKDWKTVYMKYNAEALIIGENNCEETSENFYYICFKGAVVNFSGVKDIGRIDEISGETIPALNLTITYRRLDITVNRVFSKKNPIVMESVDVNVIIENKGKNPADIEYTEVIPLGLEVTSLSSVIYDGGKIIYRGMLNPGSKSILSYRIIPLKELEVYIQGNLTYSYETQKVTINLTKTRINTSDTITLVSNIAEKMNIEEKGALYLIMKNNDSKNNVKTNLSFSFPKELKVSSMTPKDIKKIGEQEYMYECDIEKQGFKELEINFETTKTGVYQIPINLKYIVYGQKHLSQKNVSIKVISGKLTPSIIINEESIMANQKFKVKGVIKNNDTAASYYRIKAYIKSGILNESFAADKIIQNEEKILIDKEIIAPIVNKTTIFILNFSGGYETLNSETFTFFASKKITILPPSELIVIYHEFDKYLNDSDKARIKVYIENKRDSDLTANINETIPLSFNVTEGETRTKVTIAPKRKSLAYIYTIQSIDAGKKDELTSTLRFTETDREFTLTQRVSVNISAKTSLNKEVITEVSGGETNKTAGNETQQSKADNKNTGTQEKNNNTIVTKPVKKTLLKRFFLWVDSLF